MTSLNPTTWLDSLFPAPTSIVLVTGLSGCGKTAFCLRAMRTAREARWRVAGVVCPGTYSESGERIGIDLLDPATDQRRTLATARIPRPPSGSRWRFLKESLAHGAALLAASGSCDLLIVDEIGPLELLNDRGWANALDVLRTQAYARALVVVRPSLLDMLKERIEPLPVHVVSLPQQL